MKIEPRRIYEEPPRGATQWALDDDGRWFRRNVANPKTAKGWMLSETPPERLSDLRLASLKRTRLPRQARQEGQ